MNTSSNPVAEKAPVSDLSMLSRWVKWFTWTLATLGAFFLVLFAVYRSPASLIISALMLLVFLPVMLYGMRAVARKRPGLGLASVCFCCWSLALLVAARGHTALPASLPLSLLPMIFALPYVDRGVLLKIALGALIVIGVGSAMTVGSPLLASRIDEHTLGIIMVPITVISTGLAIFGLWYVGSTLRTSLRATEIMNRELGDSERALERKVQDRTSELELAVSELSDIHEIARAVNVTLDLDDVLEAMQSALQRLLAFDSLSLLLLDDDKRRLRVDHVAGIEFNAANHRRILEEGVPADDESSIFTATLSRKHPILMPEIAAEQIAAMSPTDKRLYDVNPVRSLLVCPLEFAGEPIGVLTLGRSEDTMVLTEEEVGRVQRYITPLAIVIRNAHLLEEAEEARADAIESSRAKSQFLANMSHELRTPLNAIIGYCELVAEEAEDAGHEAYLDDLAKIRTSGHYLLQLISSVLDLTRIEAGKLELSVSEFDVRTLLEEVTETTSPLAAREDNQLELEIDGDPGSMTSDLTKVRQILLNLLSNACKFTHQGTIVLRVRREEGKGSPWVRFEVIDSGIGMSDEQQARIFEAFTQADESTSRRYGGTGLGLTISREFCELLGGAIEVSSEEGKGSTFTVLLPARLDVADQPR